MKQSWLTPKVDDIDASALQILSELVNSYQERGVGIYFAHLHPQQLEKFHVIGIPQMVSCLSAHVHSSHS
jgi:MFS superfamily sulfate permease-like transporter